MEVAVDHEHDPREHRYRDRDVGHDQPVSVHDRLLLQRVGLPCLDPTGSLARDHDLHARIGGESVEHPKRVAHDDHALGDRSHLGGPVMHAGSAWLLRNGLEP